MNGLRTIKARGITAFIETFAHRIPFLTSHPVIYCPQRPQIRQGPTAPKIPVVIFAKIKRGDSFYMVDMPLTVIAPGHTGRELAF